MKNAIGNSNFLVSTKTKAVEITSHIVDKLEVEILLFLNENNQQIESAPIFSYLKNEKIPYNIGKKVLDYLRVNYSIKINPKEEPT